MDELINSSINCPTHVQLLQWLHGKQQQPRCGGRGEPLFVLFVSYGQLFIITVIEMEKFILHKDI